MSSMVAELDMGEFATKQRIVQELARIGFADIGMVAEWDEAGAVKFIASTKLDIDKRVPIASITKEVSPKGATSIKLQMVDKLGALDKMCKILGLYQAAPLDGVGGLVLNIHMADGSSMTAAQAPPQIEAQAEDEPVTIQIPQAAD